MSICSQLPQLAISVSELLCAWCCITGIVFCWCYGRILFIVGCKVRDLIGTDCSATNLLCPWCYAASNYAACWMLCHTYAMHSRCRIGSSDGESLAQLFASGKLRGNWRKWQKRTLTVICLPWRCQQWLLHPISNPPASTATNARLCSGPGGIHTQLGFLRPGRGWTGTSFPQSLFVCVCYSGC